MNAADPNVLDLVGVVRSDWTRPYNVGDMLNFGEDNDPWNDPKPVRSRLGEFELYDEYDPRKVVTLINDGSKYTGDEAYLDAIGSGVAKDWLLNFVSYA